MAVSPSGQCGSGLQSGSTFTVAAFQETQRCQSSSAIGCLHGACCVLLLDGSTLTLGETHRWTLVGLFSAWAAVLFGTFAIYPAVVSRDHPHFQREGRIPRRAKILSSVILVVIAFVLLDALCRCAGTVADFADESRPAPTLSGDALARSTAAVCRGGGFSEGEEGVLFGYAYGSFAALVAIGMTLGLVGDVVFPLSSEAAILSFSAGHICYALAFSKAAHQLIEQFGTSKMAAAFQPRSSAAPRAPAEHIAILLNGIRAVVFVIATARAWVPVGMWKGLRGTTVVGWLGLAYCFVIAETAARGVVLALLDPVHFLLVGIGMSLFVASDIAVAWAVTGRRHRYFGLHIGDYIWLTYGPAQCLIVFSAHALWLSTQAAS